nr:ATP-binding protein [Ramlibacter albus]
MDLRPGDDVPARGALRWLAEPDRPRLRAILERALEDGTPFDVESQALTARGRRIWVRIICEAEWDGAARVQRLHGALQDITESKQAQLALHESQRCLSERLEERVAERTRQLRLANEELEALAYSIAHDLRAPMTALHGFSRLLHDNLPALDSRNKHYLGRIMGNVRHMSELTDALLSLAGLSSVEMVNQPVDLAVLAREALQRQRELEPARELDAIIAETLPAVGDPALLQRVMANLVGNAWKFSRPKPRTVIRVGSEWLPDGVAYYVQDCGVGFDMAHAANLFGAFRRLHTAEYEGTGIGLALVRKIVTRHGGRVWAEARPGEGATVWFTLAC